MSSRLNRLFKSNWLHGMLEEKEFHNIDVMSSFIYFCGFMEKSS